MTKRDWRAQEFRRMVTFGPSITAGGNATCRERCWSLVLGDLITDFQSAPVEVFNMGIGATVLSTRSPRYRYLPKPAGMERVQRDIVGKNCDLLVIAEFSVNDAMTGTPVEAYREDLIGVIREVRQSIDPVIVLTGPTYVVDYNVGGKLTCFGSPELLDEYNKVIAQVAVSESCLYVDILATMAETDWMVHNDGIHLSDLGHRVLADEIFKTLAQNCSCLAAHTKELETAGTHHWREPYEVALMTGPGEPFLE